MNIVRHDFSGGLIGKELHWRSDLEQYSKSLIQSNNMMATPYGGSTRRPPLVHIGSISSITENSVIYYPSDARAFDFIYSSTYRYIVIFVVYSADGEDDITRIIVQNTDGVDKAAITSPYTQQQVLELDTHQSNESMWIAHNDVEPYVLVRNADDDWTLGAQETFGGPFLDENDNGKRKVATYASTWQADIQYQTGDKVLPEAATTDDVTWFGTIQSHSQNSTYASEYDFSAVTWYWKEPYFFKGGAKRQFFQNTYYPYLLVRVNNATPPAEAVVGATAKLSITFSEAGNDTDFDTTGEIVGVYDAGSVYYVLIDNGASYDERFVQRHSSPILGEYACDPIDHKITNLPDVEIPAAYTSSYNTDRLWEIGEHYCQYDTLSDSHRRAHFLVFGISTGGGAEISNSTNLILANASNYYEAQQNSVNKKPTGSITAFADGGGGQVTVTSAGHTVANGDQVTITGTTNYNGTFTVSNVTANTFEITDTWVSDDATGTWVNDTEWTADAIANLTGSPIAEVRSFGFSDFTDDDVGRILRIRYGVGVAQTGTFTAADQVSDELTGLGIVTLSSDGAYDGELVLESKAEGSDLWEVVGALAADGKSRSGSVVFESETLNTKLRVRMDDFQGGSANAEWTLETSDGAYSIYQILSVLDSSTAVCRNLYGITTFTLLETMRYAMGAWGGEYGFPGTVTIYENRLWYGGSVLESFRFWGSVVGKYDNFAIGSFATSALIFESRVDSSTRISWMEPKDALFFGTDFGEYSAINPDSSEVLSASNPPRVERHTSEGSSRIPARVTGNAIAFISADGQKLKLLRYDAIEQDGYRSYDMTHLNPDLARSGFIGVVLQRTPYPALWLWNADGDDLSLTLDREHGVIGWGKHTTQDGTFLSMCVAPDENGIDEVYAVVDRPDILAVVSEGGTPDVSGDYVLRDGLLVVGSGEASDNGLWLIYDNTGTRPTFGLFAEIANPTKLVEYETDIVPTVFDWTADVTTVASDTSFSYVEALTDISGCPSEDGYDYYLTVNDSGPKLLHYSMSSPSDISTMTKETDELVLAAGFQQAPFAVAVSPDKTKLFTLVTQFSAGYYYEVKEWLMSTPNDISTATVQNTINVTATATTDPRLHLSGDGKHLIISNTTDVYHVAMPTAYSLAGASNDYSETVAGLGGHGLVMNPAGTEMYTHDAGTIRSWTLSTDYDFRTRTLVDTDTLTGYAATWHGLGMCQNGSRILIDNNDNIGGEEVITFDIDSVVTPSSYEDGWNIADDFGVESTDLWPDETGWVAFDGTTAPPVIVYKVLGYRESDQAYVIIEYNSKYYIGRVSDGVLLFETTDLDGLWTAVSGSGASGSVEYGVLSYHIEKLDYSETEWTDNLNGPVEEDITSLMEPTPLSRGPDFLEGNKKFRSTRVMIYVVESDGGEVSTDGGANFTTLDYSGLTADANGLYTGMIEMPVHSGYVDYSTVQVRTTGKKKLTVTAIMLDVDKHERK